MSGPGRSMLDALQERAKELHCLYRVHEICGRVEAPLDEIFREVVAIIPIGWQHPPDCFVRIIVGTSVYGSPLAEPTPWFQTAPIRVQGEVVGQLEVSYGQLFPPADEGPFLKEERKLINTIAELLGQLLLHRQLVSSILRVDSSGQSLPPEDGDWWVIVDFLRQIDRPGYIKIARRMLNYLCWNGVEEAQTLLPRFTGSWSGPGGPEDPADENRPMARRNLDVLMKVAEEVFEVASRNLVPAEILTSIQKWIKDDRSGFLIEAVENQGTSLTELAQALARFHHAALNDGELSRSIQVDLRVALARRFLTDHIEFVGVAKNYIGVSDFYELTRRIICPPGSHGKVGGKSSGLFLAVQIVRKSEEYAETLKDIRIPKTWYITSDGVLNFIEYNHLEDLYDRKYLEIDQVRREYPHIIQVFKNSQFSPEIIKGLSLALDDFEERPIIVQELEPPRGPRRLVLLGEVQEPLPRQPGPEEGAARGAHGRHRGGLRVDLRPRPDRVPRRARPPRRPRGDGDPDPGGRRVPGGTLLPPDLRRRRLLEQRVPLVGAHPARGRPRPPRPGSRDARRGPGRATTTRSSSRPGSPG